MWIKFAVFFVAAALILVLLKIFSERKTTSQGEGSVNELQYENSIIELDDLSLSQLKHQLSILEQHKTKLSTEFIGKSADSQQLSLERIRKINDKIERLKEAISERDEFEFPKQ